MSVFVRDRIEKGEPMMNPENSSDGLERSSVCEDGTPIGCGPHIDRRNFIKLAGIGVVSSSTPWSTWAGCRSLQPDSDPLHEVPADKALPPEWYASLYEHGQTTVYSGRELETIGMPIGGIAAGQLYLLGDGRLGCWQIFNRHINSGYGRDSYKYRTPDSPLDQGFAVDVRYLDASDDAMSFEADGGLWLLNREYFPDVTFTGEYPIGRVRYTDDGCPVDIEMEAFSPFIPLNAEDSALPATVFHITVKNTSDRPVSAKLYGWLENAVFHHSGKEINAHRRSRIVREGDRLLVVHTGMDIPEEVGDKKRSSIVLADFEGEDYGRWTVTGRAFGDQPAAGTAPTQQPVTGFEGDGLVNTYLNSDVAHGVLTSPIFKITRRHINFLIGGGSHSGDTCINLLIDGKTVRTATGRNEERLIWNTWDVSDFEGRDAIIAIVDRHSGGWGHINIDQIEMADTARFGPGGPVDKAEDYGSMVLAMIDDGGYGVVDQYPKGEVDDRDHISALNLVPESSPLYKDIKFSPNEHGLGNTVSNDIHLEPGEERTITFVLAWHFPNQANGGRLYATWFDDAKAVARYVLDHIDRLTRETNLWHDTYYDSTLPHWLLDRLHWPVSNLATGTCQWFANGRFWAWEGVGCCAGTCTHVWNYAHASARLFPSLERSVREMQDLGEAFHEESGLVGFRGMANGWYAADGQAGTVLKCYREHLMSADDGFLKRNWPRVRKALEYSIAQDADADGLIENSQHNTYDINFQGPNTMVGSLYLAALRAGETMAREMDDIEFADRCRTIFEAGSQRSSENLFNGEYFVQLVDLGAHPKHQYGDGCLSDQLFGQGWADQIGLGYLYPEEQVRTALESIWKYNWAPDITQYNEKYKPERWFIAPGEPGLFTCTWPKSAYLNQGVRYRNEVWTGIEYQVAGHMIWEGMLDEGLSIIRAVHNRYHPLTHNPYNEVECGDHYARAMASWGCYQALLGMTYHGPDGVLEFDPRLSPEDFRAAFTTAEGWGTYSQRRGDGSFEAAIDVKWGRLRLTELTVRVPGVEVHGGDFDVTVECSGRAGAVAYSVEIDDGVVRVCWGDGVVFGVGERIVLRVWAW